MKKKQVFGVFRFWPFFYEVEGFQLFLFTDHLGKLRLLKLRKIKPTKKYLQHYICTNKNGFVAC